MYFNDGANPWTVDENYIRVFDFSNPDSNSAKRTVLNVVVTIAALVLPSYFFQQLAIVRTP
jgi:hypothetical protein